MLHSLGDISEIESQKGNGGANCDVRVLFLFTASATGLLANINTHAQAHIDQTNAALANSAVTSSQLRFELANAVTLASVNETGLTATQVLNAVRVDPTAQGLRDGNDADLVCLVADHTIAAFGGTLGIAFTGGSGNPAPNFSAYSVIRLFANLGDMLFSHEGGHNMGCGHEAAANPSTNIDHAWEWSWTTGWWFWRREHRRQSIMWSTANSAELAAHYSNPSVNNNGQATGTATAKQCTDPA